MSTVELYNHIEQLPPQEQIALIKQILTGLSQQIPTDFSLQSVKKDSTFPPQRIPGLHAGMAWVSEDFDEPLADEFWLGAA